MADGDFQRLDLIERTAATARVLNLAMVHRSARSDSKLDADPFFTNKVLNRSIFVKHKLRAGELELFEPPRRNATKILIPFDREDLKVGASVLFVSQKKFSLLTNEFLGETIDETSRDWIVLDLMDKLPSLDPFLLREQLARYDIHPSIDYFDLRQAEVARMHQFVRAEVRRLVDMSMAESSGGLSVHVDRMVEKILSASPEQAFAPLKMALRLSDEDYRDGLFAWRGFLYYKWRLVTVFPDIKSTLESIAAVRPRNRPSSDEAFYISSSLRRLSELIRETARKVSASIALYDQAYVAMIDNEDPAPFRTFLLAAPQLFQELGSGMGALQHIVGFWKFRHRTAGRAGFSSDEYVEILKDFVESLAV